MSDKPSVLKNLANRDRQAIYDSFERRSRELQGQAEEHAMDEERDKKEKGYSIIDWYDGPVVGFTSWRGETWLYLWVSEKEDRTPIYDLHRSDREHWEDEPIKAYMGWDENGNIIWETIENNDEEQDVLHRKGQEGGGGDLEEDAD